MNGSRIATAIDDLALRPLTIDDLDACRTLLTYGGDTIGVTDVWAGVTKGNAPSERVLERLGFERVADMGSYTRFHRSLP